jgi:hypothetical protein
MKPGGPTRESDVSANSGNHTHVKAGNPRLRVVVGVISAANNGKTVVRHAAASLLAHCKVELREALQVHPVVVDEHILQAARAAVGVPDDWLAIPSDGSIA